MTGGGTRLALAVSVMALALAACGPTGGGGGGSGGTPGYPQPSEPGTPVGEPTSQGLGGAGGAFASLDGFLVVDVPPGAVTAMAAFTVQEVTNLAPLGLGSAWQLGPEGMTFAQPITLTFYTAMLGRPIDELNVAYQDAQGYWHRAAPEDVTRDPVSQAISVRTLHFSSWALTAAPTAYDLTGPLTMTTTLGAAVTATGTATFTWAGEDDAATYYLLSGELVLPTPVMIAGTSCSPPLGATFPLRTNVAELTKTSPAHFQWGTSAAWTLSCDDGSSRVISMAFDTAGISSVGCTGGWTTPEAAGASAASGGVTLNCAAQGGGTIASTWQFQSAACGTPCASTDPCHTATVQCTSGAAVCVDSGNVPDGSACGTDQVCSAGTCTGCAAGQACTPSNPCAVGVTSCATGTSACVESTAPATPVADGTSCGTDQVCSAGACVACAAGVACTPTSGPCHSGVTSCATGTSVCVDTGATAVDGTSCGTDQVCFAGTCIACAQGSACTSTNACATAATYECSSGVPVCTDRAFQAAGTSCGPGLVCSASGSCSTCTAGATCASTNPCATSATISCASGAPVCTDQTFQPAGTACGNGQVCSTTGQCVSCTAGTACTPAGSPCAAGTISCASGAPVCAETGPAPDGTTCGTNQVCSAGTCVACAQGALCTSPNTCTSIATVQCATGSPVCTDQSYLAAGASCGTNQVCSATHVCTACTAGAACTPTNPCTATATIQCGTGEPVCVDATSRPAGTSCGTDQVCSPTGTCIACTQGATCTSTDPCVATASIQCGSGNPVCTALTYQPDATTCGSGQTCNAGTCVASRTVTGSRRATYWPDAGAQAPVAAPDVGTAQVSALVPDGRGGWSTYPGTIAADGSFTIPAVPAGAYWLRLLDGTGLSTYLHTTSSVVDLGYDQLGRSSVTRAANPTSVTFRASLPTPWARSGLDQLHVASSNADVWDRIPSSGQNRWTDNWGSTSFGKLALNLIQSGDSNTLYHLISARDGTTGPYYVSARSSNTVSNVTIVSGQSTTLQSRQLTNVTATLPLAGGAWDLSSWGALRPDMNLPAAAVATHSLSACASVGTLTGNGPVPRTVPCLFLMTFPGTTASPVTLGSGLTFGRALPTTLWTEWREVSFYGPVGYLASGATTAFTESVSVGRRDAVTATTFAPAVSPVRNLRVTATSQLVSPALGNVIGTGPTPVFAWDVPLTGTVSSYTLDVYRLGTDAVTPSQTTSTRVATFVTGDTSVAIPPGLLTTGATYYARVTARAIVSDPWANAPFRRIVLGAWAQTLTGTFTP